MFLKARVEVLGIGVHAPPLLNSRTAGGPPIRDLGV